MSGFDTFASTMKQGTRVSWAKPVGDRSPPPSTLFC
jgi:hypothetical protein